MFFMLIGRRVGSGYHEHCLLNLIGSITGHHFRYIYNIKVSFFLLNIQCLSNKSYVFRVIKTDRTVITQNLCISLLLSHLMALTTLDRHYLHLDDVMEIGNTGNDL